MRVLVALVLGIVYGGLALGNRAMVQRLFKSPMLNEVESVVRSKISNAVSKAMHLASGKKRCGFR